MKQTENYGDAVTVVARIAACTPHSADFERCISANNLFNTSQSNVIRNETKISVYQFQHAYIRGLGSKKSCDDLDEWKK